MHNVMHTPAELNAEVKPKQGKDNSGEESATRGDIILYDSFVQCYTFGMFGHQRRLDFDVETGH